MPKVTFLPINVTVDCKVDQTLLEVAQEHDIPLMHACGGFCACTTCHVHVKAGAENLGEMEEDEDERLSTVDDFHLSSRLSCQTKVRGDVTVHIMNVDR